MRKLIDSFEAVDESGDVQTIFVYQDFRKETVRGGSFFVPGLKEACLEDETPLNRQTDDLFIAALDGRRFQRLRR